MEMLMYIPGFSGWPMEEKAWYWVTQYVYNHPGTSLQNMLAYFKPHEEIHGPFVEHALNGLLEACLVECEDDGYYLA